MIDSITLRCKRVKVEDESHRKTLFLVCRFVCIEHPGWHVLQDSSFSCRRVLHRGTCRGVKNAMRARFAFFTSPSDAKPKSIMSSASDIVKKSSPNLFLLDRMECAVCLEDIVSFKNAQCYQCKYIFHLLCVRGLQRCPMCRHQPRIRKSKQ